MTSEPLPTRGADADTASDPGENVASPSVPAVRGSNLPATPPPPVPSAAPGNQDHEPERPRAVRVPEGAWLGGVCTGLAEHLGWPVMVLRVGFVVLSMIQLIGLGVYAVLWLALPTGAKHEAPGLEANARKNMRGKKKKQSRDTGAVIALVMLAAGLMWFVQSMGLGPSNQFFWPIAFAGAGVALVWRTADTSSQEWKPDTDGPAWLAPFVARGRLISIARIILGLGLVGAAAGLVIASQAGLELLPQTFAMTGLALAGVGLVSAPWVYRSRRDLARANEEKVRADERADMAAHLHDSVLQTLALIQKQSDDPKQVAFLARKQERELRTWLYGDVLKEKTLKAALTAAATEVDDERGVPVEVVCVGDVDLDDRFEAMIRAAREAMMNAAKHSGAPRIDVYAEVSDDLVEIFVKDRGKGFDMADIGDDRMGVKGSIIGRMERYGGTARIRSSAETGTEVRLEMKR